MFHQLIWRDRQTGNPLAGLSGAKRARINWEPACGTKRGVASANQMDAPAEKLLRHAYLETGTPRRLEVQWTNWERSRRTGTLKDNCDFGWPSLRQSLAVRSWPRKKSVPPK
jgi:hypothetical protein